MNIALDGFRKAYSRRVSKFLGAFALIGTALPGAAFASSATGGLFPI